MRIGIDLDDVVFEFVRGIIPKLNEVSGKNLKFEDFFSYYFPEIFDLSVEKIENAIKELIDEGLNLNLELCFGAVNSLFELSKKNKLYFITSRTQREGTEESLKNYFSEIEYGLFFSSNPYVGTEGKTKGEICQELGIDFMIEDSYEHAIKCAEKGIKCFLLKKPWNKGRKENEKIIRVDDWKEILEKLENEN
jgi:uncharacterized HAD superfamily protein